MASKNFDKKSSGQFFQERPGNTKKGPSTQPGKKVDHKQSGSKGNESRSSTSQTESKGRPKKSHQEQQGNKEKNENKNRLPFPPQTQQNRRFHKKNYPEEAEAPVQIRVYSGNKEFSTQNTHNFRPTNDSDGNQFHTQMQSNTQLSHNFGKGQFPKPMYNNPQPFHNFQSGQFKKQMNINSQLSQNFERNQFQKHIQGNSEFDSARVQLNRETGKKKTGYQLKPQNKINSPKFFDLKQFNPQQTLSIAGKLPYKSFVNQSEVVEPFFFKSHSNKTNSSVIIQKSVDINSLSNVPSKNKNTPSKTSPVYKFKNNAKPKKINAEPNLTNESQSSQSKNRNQQKAHNRRRKPHKPNLWKKKTKSVEAIPFFSFKSNPTNAVPTQTENKDEIKSLIDFGDDNDDDVSMSRCSSDESICTTNISDDELDNFSDESEVISEVSFTSSMKDSEISEITDSGISSYQSGKISVFWDIENCPVPSEKSAVDFVKLVRTMLYQGRTEANFSVVCDVRNLNNVHSEEFYSSDVTVFHMSSTNKNAADTKIKSLLFEFRDFYKDQTNCAVVLISGDSDFAQILNTLRFKHNIHIYLICRNNARHSLIESAHQCIFYEDFVKKLPSRSKSDDVEYLIIVSNYPESLSPKQVKALLSSRLKGVNCRIKNVTKTSAEIISPDDCIRKRALLLLQNFEVNNCEIKSTCVERKKMVSKTDTPKVVKAEPQKKPVMEENKKIDNSKKKKNVPENKGATLCIYVSIKAGDIMYWRKELETLWSTSDFTLQWEGEHSDGYFLANFKSLKKAQKVKKILQKSQNSDPLSPKFLKLIKQDGILSDLHLISSIQDINRKKLAEHIQIIESKKEVCLNKHKQSITDQKAMSSLSVSGAREALAAKLTELNEQKITFLNYAQMAIDKVKNIDLASENIDKILVDILHDFTRECNCLSTALPIYAKKSIILKKVKKHQVVIIRAETGSGKSTQLVQYIWREQMLSREGLIICTQPRKIAAISLAKHISTQVGCSLGDIVGYQVGVTTKQSPKTAILYVTDFAMLKMLVNGKDFNGISCIIVDEAHERTVYTDLLLGMIKDCLKKQPDLKLIITSATIDITIFKDYLGVSDEAVLEISGKTFPIEDVWLDYEVSLGWDYFKKTIDTVYTILNQEMGDILVFLTTPFETEKAVKDLSGKLDAKLAQNVKIYQLHGKLDVQEQQKIFDRTPKDTRKVVFSTNCAETSVTIPGIKYVVDCGMVKESQYDSIKKMNILSVNFVSQSSAEQRRGRAGRTQVGKCYRLYSKKNYESMIKNTEPEIMRTNIGRALLRLMKLGVNDPIQFDFVQSPPEKVLNSAMQQLLDLNAVNLFDMTLSEMGEKMSYLPLEPRLSFMVFTGIESNIGYEAIVLAALVSISRSIFFRNTENKSEADVKKLRFCQSESDFLTYFEVYKEWVTVPKESKSKWCTLNCINARSLRTAQDLINEIIHIIKNELKIKIPVKFNENSVNDAMLKLIFRSFYQNLCIFSGHHKFGYRSIDFSGDLLIHPSSSLYTYGHWRPQFIVYDTVLKTNQTYLINISHVSKEVILECMDNYGMSIHLAGLEALPLTTYGLTHIGKSILLRDIVGKRSILRKKLENQLKDETGSEHIVIDVEIQKGEVKVCGPQNKYNEIEAILCPLIKKAQERLLLEEKEVFIYPEMCGIISAGLAVKDVVLPGEFRDIKVALNTDVEVQSVVEKLETCGQICTVREWNNYFKVTFMSPNAAKLALKEFSNDESFTLKKMLNTNIFDGRMNQYKIQVSYLRRECTGEAFIATEPPLGDSLLPLICYRENMLKCNICKTSDLRVVGLPFDTQSQDFVKFVTERIPEGYKLKKCVVVRKKPYESSKEEMEIVKQKLFALFTQFTDKDKLSIDLKKPIDKTMRWHAFVFFQNPYDGETAVSVLKNRKNIGDIKDLQMDVSLQTCLYCKREVFKAIEEQVKEALEHFKNSSEPGNTLNIDALPKGEDNVQIKITSNNILDISNARETVLNFLLGDEIKCSCNSDLEKLFSKTGQEHLKKISEINPQCYVEFDMHKKILTVFGNESAINLVKLEINALLENLSKENIKEISLMPEDKKPGVLRKLLNKYGHDLEKLKVSCGLTSVEVNARQHILTIRGSNAAVDKCQDIINDLKIKVEEIIYEEDTELCPICFDKISDQHHRLEYCGHAYCKECILHWFHCADSFPLSCITCENLIVLEDIYWASKELKSLDMELYKKAVAEFVKTRSDVNYCPSPDCPMIFRVNTDEKVFNCPLCNNSICTSCQEIYHYGMSCSLNKVSKGDSDYSLKAWMLEDPENRKSCPSCSAPIEKNYGCNHLTCLKCKCHICWFCLKVFPTGASVYTHMPYCAKRTPENVMDLLL